MFCLKHLFLILLCWTVLEVHSQADGSQDEEPSHFFMTDPLFTLEDILGDSLDLEEAFHDLPPEERTQFAESIATLSDAFLEVLLEAVDTSTILKIDS